jgi:hypothetical protein
MRARVGGLHTRIFFSWLIGYITWCGLLIFYVVELVPFWDVSRLLKLVCPMFAHVGSLWMAILCSTKGRTWRSPPILDSLHMFSNVKQVMAEKLALQVSQKKGVYGKNPARLNVTTELNSWVCLTIGYPWVPQISWLSCFFYIFCCCCIKTAIWGIIPSRQAQLALGACCYLFFLSIESATIKITAVHHPGLACVLLGSRAPALKYPIQYI